MAFAPTSLRGLFTSLQQARYYFTDCVKECLKHMLGEDHGITQPVPVTELEHCLEELYAITQGIPLSINIGMQRESFPYPIELLVYDKNRLLTATHSNRACLIQMYAYNEEKFFDTAGVCAQTFRTNGLSNTEHSKNDTGYDTTGRRSSAAIPPVPGSLFAHQQDRQVLWAINRISSQAGKYHYRICATKERPKGI